MRTLHLRIFQREVELQCRFALIAWQDLNAALEEPAGPDTDRVWYSLQSVLIAVADVSKLLWPSPGRNKGKPLIPERGDELRASLSVTEPSPLKTKDFRNTFDHFDERLERWATSVDGKNLIFVDSNIGPVELMTPFGLPPQKSLRNYSPQDGTLTYRGDVHELWPVIAAVRELWEKAAVEANKSVPPSGQEE